MSVDARRRDEVTAAVRGFYNETPFPNYDDIDNRESLVRKARAGWFGHALDNQIPVNARVLECGCGTGQLSNFLALKDREVFAADLSIAALKIGREFAGANGISSVTFVNMDLFAPPFATESFDLVISNGVLHHTADTRAAFESIAGLVKPGGYIIIGLYHRWGRLITDMRRLVFRLFGEGMRFLDPNLRGGGVMTDKQYAWYVDQYKHPLERKHTIAETVSWFEEANFEVIRSIPDGRLFGDDFTDSKLFQKVPQASGLELHLKELSMFFRGSREGGFFVLIGRKRDTSRGKVA